MEDRVKEILGRIESELDRLQGDLQGLVPPPAKSTAEDPDLVPNWEPWHYSVDHAAEHVAGAANAVNDALFGE